MNKEVGEKSCIVRDQSIAHNRVGSRKEPFNCRRVTPMEEDLSAVASDKI